MKSNGAAWLDQLAQRIHTEEKPGLSVAGGTALPPKTDLPPLLPDVKAFDPLMLPAAFRDAVIDISERMQCPMDYSAIGYMVTLSAIVGRKIKIQPKFYDDWIVVPNLWGAIIGPPGVMKTSSLVEPMRPLHKIESQARKDFERDYSKYEALQAVLQEQKKVKRDDVRKKLRKGAVPGALASELLDEATQEPQRLRVITNDSTVEKIGELLSVNENGILIFRDELTGFLRSMEKEGHESARAFYLEAWNGDGRFTFDRIGRGTVEIEAACVSILGGIQPGPLNEYVSKVSRGGGSDDGLLQRFQLVVWPDISPEWVNIDRPPNHSAIEVANKVYDRINSMGQTIILQFSPEAQSLFNEWRSNFERGLRVNGEPSIVQSHLAKYRSLVPSLAGLIHIADNPRHGPISEKSLAQALAWSEYLESHARRMYAAALNPEIPASHVLLAKVKAGRLGAKFTSRDIYLKGWTGLSEPTIAAAAAEMLVQYGHLVSSEVETGGRPKIEYRVV